jgi:gp16 family phage-associated protein
MENKLDPSNRSKTLTADEAQKWFRNNGLNISSWALEQGFTPALVYAVLQGRRKCLRGQSHQIAVALGLKTPN